MPSLRELQMGFAEAVYGTDEGGLARYVRARGLTGERRIQVYRNNTLASLCEALVGVYPVIRRLVGEDFFRHAAHHYIRQHPSTSGNLHDFGAAFGPFIARLPGAAELPYLADVACVEWAYHHAVHAAEHAPLELTRLGEVAPDRYGELRFRLHPTSRLVSSSYPVLRIWEVNQEGYAGDQTVDLSEGGVRVLVQRRRMDVELQPLGEGELALLKAMADGMDFDGACTAALAAEPSLDLAACLQQHVLGGVIVDFALPSTDS